MNNRSAGPDTTVGRAARIMRPIAGSFRDPAGQVFEADGRIIRTISAAIADDFRTVMAAPATKRLLDDGRLIASTVLDQAKCPLDIPDGAMAVEHERVPFITYPYEWSFGALKAAALLHLDLHLECMADNITLCDASAYNVQFFGARPVFIDILSLRPYRDGEPWAGYRQFCEQFINPLLLGAKLGIAPNAWYRGALEGISVTDLAPC